MDLRERRSMNNRYKIEVTRKRIKNMYLRVKDTDGTLSVSAPYGMSDTEIRKFVESKSDWIERTMQEMTIARQLKEQEPVLAPFMEREIRLELKRQLQRLIDKWEPVMGVKSAGFTIKKMKTRWGSCNVRSHHLNFNLLLAKVPPECAEYVVVHELTHLLEPSHNARFWSLMEYYLPGSKELRKQLAGFSAKDMI
ncbi:M48 family metallopeptidase [Agathobacter sp.]|uniref:M48 family metallopeptidase n=1 Tax=Agathobacter sp. TaxID=2021311 RepID=UPI003FD82EBC